MAETSLLGPLIGHVEFDSLIAELADESLFRSSRNGVLRGISDRPLRLLSPTDCIKDRLAAFFHWNDTMAFEQALLVAKAQPIDMMDLWRWAKVEGAAEKFRAFENALRKT